MIKNHPHKQVIYWLLTGCAMIYVMVVVGCITRLTHSGLSITDWSVMGTMPPMSEESWNVHFSKYQESPEFKIVNSYMKLDEFKNIFWWEWSHRMIGRMIGLVFFAGFAYFLITKKFTKKLLTKSVILMCVGALQGLVGWWMVKSGLVKNPNVSHFRLAIHLMTAFTAFAFSFWFAMELIYDKNEDPTEGKKLFSATIIMSVTVIVQIIYGAFVAGLKAGKFYNTWPKMGDQWFQGDIIFSSDTLLQSFTENPAGVQFIHRTFAWVVVCAVIYIWVRSGKIKLNKWQNNGVSAMIYLTTLQIMLGIFTLIYSVPVLLGVLHQTVAFFLFATCLYLLFHFKNTSKQINA
ncbi:MAG: COX15/CtaA family protein [Bacteroidia bacterium]